MTLSPREMGMEMTIATSMADHLVSVGGLGTVHYLQGPARGSFRAKEKERAQDLLYFKGVIQCIAYNSSVFLKEAESLGDSSELASDVMSLGVAPSRLRSCSSDGAYFRLCGHVRFVPSRSTVSC
jgi:hypothetical protein